MTLIDTSNCETEPIRFPGAVQPHGALLVLGQYGLIEAASESCEAMLGRSAASLLGQALGSIFDLPEDSVLMSGPHDGLQPLVHLSFNGRELRCRATRNAAAQVLIDIEAAAPDSARIRAMTYRCRRELSALRHLDDVPAITQQVAQLFRALTGFDRVMVYRFDAAFNGEVIAEARLDSLEPYLGLNYPASDIPRQARELFQASQIRMIPDVLYAPSPLWASGDRATIDLGLSSLRSVSPMHIEYLTNMAVRATLVGSLVVHGRLWGLISCQHKSGPKYLGPVERDVLGWLCEDIAALLQATLIRQQREREYDMAMRRRKLVDTIRAVDLKALMREGNSADLLEVVSADGFAFISEKSIQTTGRTPTSQRIRELQQQRRACETDPTLFASSALVRDLGVAEIADGVAGALFVSLRDRPDITLVWFRLERSYSVRWGGDPQHARLIGDDGRLSPRKSFDQFLQEVRGQCLAWTPEELHSGAELGFLIQAELQHRYKAERNILQSVLTRMNEAILVTEPDFDSQEGPNLLWVSQAFEQLSGFSSDELKGMQTNVLFGPDTSAVDTAALQAQFARHEVVRTEILRHTKQGKPFWVDLEIFPALDDAGNVTQLISIERDTTVRKQTEETLRKLTSAVEQSSASVVITDLQGTIEYVNPRFTEVSGYSAAEVMGQNPRIVQSRQTPIETYQELWNQLTSGQAWRGELLNQRKNGEVYWEESHIGPVKNAAGHVTHYVAVKTDITQRKRTESSLESKRIELRTLLQTIPDLVWLKNRDGVYLACNAAFEAFFGAPEADIIGKTDFEFMPQEIAEAFLQRDREAAEAGESTVNEEWVTFASNGRRVLLETTKTPMRDAQGGWLGVLGVAHDITQRHQVEQQVQQLAFFDALTQLPNRRLLNDRLRQALAGSKRSACYGALMFLDLDNFKPLNDMHGHAVGDLLLIEVANRLKNCVRETDTVARFGGDEFVVLLNELWTDQTKSKEQARLIADKIRAALAQPYVLKMQQEGPLTPAVEHHCTASIGVALFFDQQTSPDDVLKWADEAMYQAKATGRNHVQFYDEKA